MANYDTILTLFTIVFGLMLTVLFSSFHKLLKHRKSVKWHWMPIISGWYLFLTILNIWWDLSQYQGNAGNPNKYIFIAYGHWLFITFLTVSTVLPNHVDQSGINLKRYYFDNHRYFWGLISLVVVSSNLINLFNRIEQLDSLNIFILPVLFILPALTLVLAITKKYWVHSAILIILVLGVIFELIR